MGYTVRPHFLRLRTVLRLNDIKRSPSRWLSGVRERNGRHFFFFFKSPENFVSSARSRKRLITFSNRFKISFLIFFLILNTPLGHPFEIFLEKMLNIGHGYSTTGKNLHHSYPFKIVRRKQERPLNKGENPLTEGSVQ